MDEDGSWHGGRPQPKGLCVRWGPSLFLKKGQSQFSAHFYCGQTAGCIKMALDMEVGLSPGDVMLDGDPVPPSEEGAEHPIFGQRILWPNGCMDQEAAGYGGRCRPTRHCVRSGTNSPSPKGAQPLIFGRCSLLPSGCMD